MRRFSEERFESSHPFHTRKSPPYSQFLRIRRICTHRADFFRNALQLKSYFLDRGYPHDILVDAFVCTLTQDHQTLLFPPPPPSHPAPSPPTPQSKDSLFAITTYDPCGAHFSSPPIAASRMSKSSSLSSALLPRTCCTAPIRKPILPTHFPPLFSPSFYNSP